MSAGRWGGEEEVLSVSADIEQRVGGMLRKGDEHDRATRERLEALEKRIYELEVDSVQQLQKLVEIENLVKGMQI